MADDCNAVVAVLLLLLHSCPYGVGSNSQVYEENLFLRGLPGDKVLAFFMFKTTWHISREELHKDVADKLQGLEEVVRWVASFTTVRVLRTWM